MGKKQSKAEELLSSPPMLVANLYDITAILGVVRQFKILADEGEDQGDKNALFDRGDWMQYTLVALQDILVHDYAIPCELGLKPIDVARNSIFLFDDAIMQCVDAGRDTKELLDVTTLCKFQEIISNTKRMKVVIKDIVETHRMRCNPDHGVCLFPLAESLGVGFRAMK